MGNSAEIKERSSGLAITAATNSLKQGWRNSQKDIPHPSGVTQASSWHNQCSLKQGPGLKRVVACRLRKESVYMRSLGLFSFLTEECSARLPWKKEGTWEVPFSQKNIAGGWQWKAQDGWFMSSGLTL